MSPITTVQFSANNRFLVTAAKDGSVRLWSVANGVTLRVRGFLRTGPVFSADGKHMYAVGGSGRFHAWHADGPRAPALRLPGSAGSVDLTNGADRVVYSTDAAL